MPITYSFSGNWDDYCRFLRRFTLDELLKCISHTSTLLFQPDVRGAKCVKIQMMESETRRMEPHTVLITAWGLVDMSYHAILASNDYRGRKIETDYELILLCLADNGYLQKREKILIDRIKADPSFMFYVWGFAGEQFKIQNAASVFKNAARELYILFECARHIDTINVADIVKKEIGVDWLTLLSSTLLAWFGYSHESTLKTLKSVILWDDSLSRADFEKVISHYAATYYEVRDSKLGRQFLYTHPFIITQRGETISVSCYLNLFLYEHCVLWAVRDYFRKIGSQQFTSEFGKLYEEYFRKVLSEYVELDRFERIPENGKQKRADWKLKLFEYDFLIEQKSTILRLGAKQQECNYEYIEKFAIDTVIKALKQLQTTEEAFNDGSYIKIVLLYDDYLHGDFLDHIFRMPECDVINDGTYWTATIEEFEELLYAYKYDEAVCHNIISQKYQREKSHSTEGKSLKHLIELDGISMNMHLQHEWFVHYEKMAQECLRKHMPKSGEGT